MPLHKSQVTPLQQVCGTFLYYAIAVDPTMLVALGTISAAQSNATDHTATAVVKLLNYAATNPDAVIRYKVSGTTLYIHSDASYLSEPKARS
jgi:N-acetylmuramic acid 6-phosphate (MurNAc-6-P) etherase